MAVLNAVGGGGGGAGGGYISGPGGPRSDSIMARISDGEYVVNADATKKNRTILDAINSGTTPRFADGGPVGRSSKGLIKDGGRSTTVNMGDINVEMSGSSGDPKRDADYQMQTAKMVRAAVREEIADWYLDHSRPGGMLTDNTA